MRTHFRTFALACFAAFLLHCSTSNPQPPIDTNGGASSSGSSSGSGSGSSSGGTVATNDGGGTTDGSTIVPTGGFAVTGTLLNGDGLTPIAGASICLVALPNECVVSASTGAFTINGLTATGSGITGSLTGFVNGVWALTPTSNISSFTGYLRTPARMTTLASDVSSTFSSAAGVIHFIAYDAGGNGLAGVTVSTSGGGTIGYFDVAGATLSTAIPETSAEGGGMIFGLAPAAQVDVTFAIAGKTCVHHDSSGFAPKSASATMAVPVIAGAVTFAGGTCT
jgi:hypothetical protein